MSNTISARGLSFCSITRSRIAMIVVLARMVIELSFLLKEIAGWTAMFGSRMIELSSWLSSVTSACWT